MRTVGIEDCEYWGLWALRTVGMEDCWYWGLWAWRIVVLEDCGHVGLWAWRIIPECPVPNEHLNLVIGIGRGGHSIRISVIQYQKRVLIPGANLCYQVPTMCI